MIYVLIGYGTYALNSIDEDDKPTTVKGLLCGAFWPAYFFLMLLKMRKGE